MQIYFFMIYHILLYYQPLEKKSTNYLEITHKIPSKSNSLSLKESKKKTKN